MTFLRTKTERNVDKTSSRYARLSRYGFLSTIQHIFHQKSYNFNLNQYYIRNQLAKLSVFIRLLIVFSDFHIFRKNHPYPLQVRPKKWMLSKLRFINRKVIVLLSIDNRTRISKWLIYKSQDSTTFIFWA
jgi:hypothetical protein